MARDATVAPKERINIVYKPAIGDAKEEIELPLKLLVLGDFTGVEDETPLEERKVINIDKTNFNDVLAAQNLNFSFTVDNKLSEEGGEIPVNLKLKSMADFGPESIVQQVPELEKLMQLRNALSTLKGPLGNVPAFRKLITSIITDETAREKLLQELEVIEKEEKEKEKPEGEGE